MAGQGRRSTSHSSQGTRSKCEVKPTRRAHSRWLRMRNRDNSPPCQRTQAMLAGWGDVGQGVSLGVVGWPCTIFTPPFALSLSKRCFGQALRQAQRERWRGYGPFRGFVALCEPAKCGAAPAYQGFARTQKHGDAQPFPVSRRGEGWWLRCSNPGRLGRILCLAIFARRTTGTDKIVGIESQTCH